MSSSWVGLYIYRSLVFGYSKRWDSKEWSDTCGDSSRSCECATIYYYSCSWCSIYNWTVVNCIWARSTLSKCYLPSIRRWTTDCSAKTSRCSNSNTSISAKCCFISNGCSSFAWVSYMKCNIPISIRSERWVYSSKIAIKSSILGSIRFRHR